MDTAISAFTREAAGLIDAASQDTTSAIVRLPQLRSAFDAAAGSLAARLDRLPLEPVTVPLEPLPPEPLPDGRFLCFEQGDLNRAALALLLAAVAFYVAGFALGRILTF